MRRPDSPPEPNEAPCPGRQEEQRKEGSGGKSWRRRDEAVGGANGKFSADGEQSVNRGSGRGATPTSPAFNLLQHVVPWPNRLRKLHPNREAVRWGRDSRLRTFPSLLGSAARARRHQSRPGQSPNRRQFPTHLWKNPPQRAGSPQKHYCFRTLFLERVTLRIWKILLSFRDGGDDGADDLVLLRRNGNFRPERLIGISCGIPNPV